MSHDSSVESGSSDSSVESGLSGTSITDVDRSSEKLKNRLFHGILVAAASFGVVMLVFLFGDIFYEAVTGQREFGIELGRFLANTGSQTPANAGFYSAIIASIWLMLLTTAFILFIGISTALYLVEYAPDNRTTRLIEANLANLAGVPSVVYGILILALIVNGAGIGSVILAGAIALSALVVPIVIVASIEAIRAVPDGMRDGSAAAGATQWQTIRRVILPQAIPGIMTGTILALARAIGETAPLLMVGALFTDTSVPSGPFDSFSSMPVQIYNWTFLPQREFLALAAMGIIVLLLILLAMQAVAVYIRRKYERDVSLTGV